MTFLLFIGIYRLLLQGAVHRAVYCARFLPSLVAGLGTGLQDDADACEPSFGVSKTLRPLAPGQSNLLAGAQHSKTCRFSTSL